MMSRRYQIGVVHFLVSLTVISACAVLVYSIWYPSPLAKLSGVNEIFLTLVAVDLVLGPLLGFIICGPKKGIREIAIDLAIIVAFQATALGYGIASIFNGRPVFIVYNVGRFDVVFANDLDADQLKAAPDRASLPAKGPIYVGAKLPDDVKARNAVLFSALEGGPDVAQMPRYYVELDSLKSEILASAIQGGSLKLLNVGREVEIDREVKRYASDPSKVVFVITKVKSSFVSTAVDSASAKPFGIVDFTSWGADSKGK